MVLKEQELLQIDEKFIQNLLKNDPDALAGLSIKLTNDLKEALERLNQNPDNSSRPPGSVSPWDKGPSSTHDENDLDTDIEATSPDEDDKEDAALKKSKNNKGAHPRDTKQVRRKPGRQPGSQGFGRTQQLQVTDIKHHPCGHCPICKEDLGSVEKAYTGFHTVNIEYGDVETPGIRLTYTHHIYYSGLCPNCGLQSRSEPTRAPANDTDWAKVGMTEWRLVGADLAAMIVYLLMDMYLTRRKVQQFLYDAFGLKLSVGTIQNCVVESGRAIAPVEEQLVEELLRESLMHADETSHKEAGALLWLWVFITSSTALFFIGYRSKEIFTNLIDSFAGFDGWLMSDGYCIYRDHPKRLRCWAHLIRKALGLSESFSKTSRSYGRQLSDILESLMDAIYCAREGPDAGKASIAEHHKEQLERLREICQEMSTSPHKKTRELGREFLNDWEAIFRILGYPAWPLTNNEAERALRHWVILRKITQGTRSEQGSRALALFASVIATCRLRNASPLLYIRDVIKLRRRGDEVPKLPLMPTRALAV